MIFFFKGCLKILRDHVFHESSEMFIAHKENPLAFSNWKPPVHLIYPELKAYFFFVYLFILNHGNSQHFNAYKNLGGMGSVWSLCETVSQGKLFFFNVSTSLNVTIPICNRILRLNSLILIVFCLIL